MWDIIGKILFFNVSISMPHCVQNTFAHLNHPGSHLSWREECIIKMFLKWRPFFLRMHATVCMIFKKCHNAVNSEIKQAREKFFKNVLNENEGNSSMTWQIIDKSTLRKIHSSSLKEIKLDKSSISDLLELLSAFNDHFSSIGLKLIDTIQQSRDTVLLRLC